MKQEFWVDIPHENNIAEMDVDSCRTFAKRPVLDWCYDNGYDYPEVYTLSETFNHLKKETRGITGILYDNTFKSYKSADTVHRFIFNDEDAALHFKMRFG